MALSVGDLLGPYEILAPIGEGGMGVVYKARDSRLRRDVAIKVLSAAAVADAGLRARFETEARAASALNHPNILAIYDLGEHEGHPYIVSEFVDGEMLRTVMDSGPIASRRLLEIAVQISDGLAAAHTANITHRDMKPENVMVTRDGRVKILDFGLAKVSAFGVDQATVVAGLSSPGMVMGTVGYMSPEQARGKQVDFRSDQFSFGVILHEMATGKNPFQRDSVPETMTAILKEEPTPLPGSMPAPLKWVVERMLAKDPEERYGSTKDLFRDLKTIRERLSEAQTSAANPVTDPVSRPARKTGWSMAAGLALATFIAGLFLGDSPSIDLARITFTTLVSGSFGYSSSVWSADGKSFLNSADGQIRQYSLGGGPEVNLLRTPLADYIPSIHPTPDGKTIYFTSLNNGIRTLFAVGAAGGEAEVVYPLDGFQSLQGVDISPDGKWIAVVRRGKETGTYQLAYASPPGSPLKDYPHAFGSPGATRQFLRFKPNGKELFVIESFNPGGSAMSEAWVLPWPPEKGVPRKLEWKNPPWRLIPEWLPDGKHLLAAASERNGEGFRLGLTTQNFSDFVPLTAGNDTNDRAVSVSKDGRALVTEGSRDFNVLAIPLDGSPVRSMGNDFLVESFPAWLPNGEQFVHFVNRRGQNEIWLSGKDGTPIRALVSGTLGPFGLDVSPDGRQMAFTAGFQLYIAPTAGGSPVAIGEGTTPTWSPDSNWVAYRSISASAQTRGIYKIRAGSQQAPIRISDLDAAGAPVWSPDGKWIAVQSVAGVELLAPDGNAKRLVTKWSRGQSDCLVWARNSQFLYLLARESGSQRIFRLQLDGSATLVRDLGNTHAGTNYVNGNTLSLSPDGKTILTTERRSHTRVLLMEGLRPPRPFWRRWLDRLGIG